MVEVTPVSDRSEGTVLSTAAMELSNAVGITPVVHPYAV